MRNLQTPIPYICNPIDDRANNLYALPLLGNSFCRTALLFASDIISEDAALDAPVSDPRNYLRLAVRNTGDNERLLAALRCELKSI